MKRLGILCFAIFSMATILTSTAQTPHPWLHVYRNSFDFFSVKLNEVQSICHQSGNEPAMHICTNSGDVDIPISDVIYNEIGTNVPTIYIDTPSSPELEELTDKETYLEAVIRVDGMGVYDDMDVTPVLIKGRGNSTWKYPKKPYRLKFAKKTDMPGSLRSKNFALIANYIDCTLMRNAIAFEVGRLLGMPFTNHAVPVRVYLNGRLKGAYFLTEKIGISGSSVDIDESTGVLLELDSNYDEKYCFRSPIYNLPVMIKDPDLDEIAEAQGTTADLLLEKWQNDFNDFEYKVYHGLLEDKIDYDRASLIDYLIVYNICGNREITWPKSTFIYKHDIDSPFVFGPVWDFDWAFTYNNGVETKAPDEQLLVSWTPLLGQPFFKKLCSNTAFKAAYRERWQYFCDELLPQLYQFIDDYAATIQPSAIENGVLWPPHSGISAGSFDFDNNVAALRDWISARVAYINSHPNCGLYN